MTKRNDTRAEAIRAALISHVDNDLESERDRAVHLQANRAEGASPHPRRRPAPARAWTVVTAVSLVAALAAIAVGSAMTAGRGEIAAATPSDSLSPSSTASPEPRYPALPDANRPLTEEALGLCRLRADIYPLGQLAIDSNAANLPQVAYNDLAAYLMTDFPDQIAAPGGGYGTTGLQIVPASADIDIQSMFDHAAVQLVPEFRALVSSDQIVVGEPIGYSFEDVCRAYLDADDLAEQAVPASGFAMPFYSLALSRFDATVQLEVPHDIPAPIQELAARYPSIVRVTAVSEDYEPPRLAAGTIDEPSPERTPSR